MNTHSVEVFNGANDDTLILVIAHDLHLELFPAQQTFFDQDLPHRGQV